MPELPGEKRARYRKEWGIKDADIEVYITTPDKDKIFGAVMSILQDKKLAQLTSNYILTDIKRNISPEVIADTIRMIDEGTLSSRGAKDLFNTIRDSETNAKKFAQENNLLQESDREVLKKVVEEIMKEHQGSPIQFLVGQAMKKTNNRANPKILQELFLEMLDR